MKNRVCRGLVLSAIAAAFFMGCSDKDNTAGGATEGGNAISKTSISGVAQKGPFVTGSKVIVYELEGESLAQTGKAFFGRTDKNGAFKLSNVSLASQYAILECTGYFYNEVTGMKSNSQISLNAIEDLSERDQVNINMMTQLEYDRVVYLVANEKMNVSDAKKKAQKELANSFFFGDENVEFENLDIFGPSEKDAMLLAISALTLAGNSDADFAELLADFSSDIEDGVIENHEKEAQMADFVSVYLDQAQVRKNVEKLSGMEVPGFEKYISSFVEMIYSLGECSEKTEGKIAVNENELSGRRNARFVCTDGAWKITFANPEIKYGSFTDERDGYTYRTTTIGEQTWFAENLRYVSTDGASSRICYDDDPKYCDLYGAYYYYKYVSCPDGWHVPSREEWYVLIDAVGGEKVAASKLRARGAWNVNKYPGVAGDKDEFGFSAMPAGVYRYGGEGHTAFFRTSDYITDSLGRVLNASYVIGLNDADSTWVDNAMHSSAISVRCVQDAAKDE